MITPKDFINHRAEKRNGYLAIEAYPHYILLKPQTGEILLESEGEEEPIVTRGLVSQVYQHYESEPLTLKQQ